jgi:hypothetical protein
MFIAKSLTFGSLRFFYLRCKFLTFIFVVAFAMAPPLIVHKQSICRNPTSRECEDETHTPKMGT